jgi:hypothetical protein
VTINPSLLKVWLFAIPLSHFFSSSTLFILPPAQPPSPLNRHFVDCGPFALSLDCLTLLFNASVRLQTECASILRIFRLDSMRSLSNPLDDKGPQLFEDGCAASFGFSVLQGNTLEAKTSRCASTCACVLRGFVLALICVSYVS